MSGVRKPFEIGGRRVAPGQRATVELPVSTLTDHTPVTLSVHVVHGKKPGPVMFVSAAIHGDEVIGVEVVRRLLRAPQLDRVSGTLLAVPIVNTFGFLNQSRYLPDRRDLNRVFPGSASGSLAARLAHLFLTEVVARCSFGIDLHSAAVQRTNLPQVRISPGSTSLAEMAEVFGAPVILTAKERDGSLRRAAAARGIDVLLYEAGEGLRFDEYAARTGVYGILRVMRAQGLIGAKGVQKPTVRPIRSARSSWLRAPAGGLMRSFRQAGDVVAAGDVLGIISDPFGENEIEVVASEGGMIVGRSILPVVNEGDALFHIAALPDPGRAEAALGALADQIEAQPLFDEDEII
ncbi:MAG: succinylglutamate desuccinylase [Limimaricola sp.]|uniref:succinylglutamate desuccinylase/aspartoacylase family protein n=1 Tax=Limimaricola sp. TaxID=2211665 RepID=UPI001D3EB709|nr:succinylglutamate desuccinylase/aspartoacylase family protein [Limimaricola sp.]MBI1416972.1 succinylglutamate desuccinylase [Limimaricola sp.]